MAPHRQLLRYSVRMVVGLFALLLALELLLQLSAWLLGTHQSRAPDQWLRKDIRVLALGDSNTYGLYLQPEDSWPAQLEKRWNETHPEQSIEIINLGYPGTNSFRLLANLPQILDTFRPDVVLLMIGFNDFWTPAETPARPGEPTLMERARIHSRVYKLFFILREYLQDDVAVDTGARQMGTLTREDLTPAEMEIIRNMTGLNTDALKKLAAGEIKDPAIAARLETALKTIVEARQKNMANKDILNTVKYGNQVFSLGVIEGKSAGNSKQMTGNLKAMLALLQQHQVKVILLDYPTAHGYYPAANNKIHQVAQETGVPFISLREVLPEPCRKNPDACPDLLYYDAHAKAEGNRLIANHIMTGMESYLSVTDK